jgi:hypothetical protein
MSWPTVSVTGPDDALVSVALPPGWSALRLSAPDLVRQVERLVADHLPAEAAPTLRSELSGEWQRLARVSAAAGAVLLGFGAAADDDADQVVTASLLLVPQHLYGDADDGPVGPEHHLRLPAGPAIRRPTLSRAPTPVGDLLELVVEYVVTPPRSPAWSLVLRTPALNHLEHMVVVFDLIAATFRVEQAAVAEADVESHAESAGDEDGPVFG